ncbi:MAG: antibiotic biosynthesis monooxygenase [Flavobacteriaceae bacterium]|nr:MAG: antibiotic biosynthesis monooxygenase [Flavobacteriaceae bacterium]
MILESAQLCVKEENQTDFERDFKIASKYICTIDGYKGHTLHKCLEDSGKYLLLVQWEKLEDHTIGFRQSEGYLKWKELLHHYYDPFPVVEYYQKVFESDLA